VGDGPWELMRRFDNSFPTRLFDNFQFVNFTEIKQRKAFSYIKDAVFATQALMEVPPQFKKMWELGILGQVRSRKPTRVKSLPPPLWPHRLPTPLSSVHQFSLQEINAAIGSWGIEGRIWSSLSWYAALNQTKIAVR